MSHSDKSRSGPPARALPRWAREPLVHFLLIGAGLFVAYYAMSDAGAGTGDRQIVVGPGRILQLATVFEKTWQRPPTRRELQGLIDDFVLEEAYFRQAVAMGIDRNDTIIRRRLRQKLEFLTDDLTGLSEATDEQLTKYLAENADSFRQSPRMAVQQVYFNPDKHGPDPNAFVAEQLRTLQSGGDAAGDPSLLPETTGTVPQEALASTFGSEFAEQLEQLETGIWHGPIRSGMGLHLVRVTERTPGRLPQLEEIRPLVLREWANERRLAARKQMNERLRKQYEVIIEWPEQESLGPGPEALPADSS